MKGDIVWSCALPVYEGTAERSSKGYFNLLIAKHVYIRFYDVAKQVHIRVKSLAK